MLKKVVISLLPIVVSIAADKLIKEVSKRL